MFTHTSDLKGFGHSHIRFRCHHGLTFHQRFLLLFQSLQPGPYNRHLIPLNLRTFLQPQGQI